MMDKMYQGGAIVCSMKMESWYVCRVACLEMLKCKVFTYLGGYCVLRSGNGIGIKNINGIVSGQKNCEILEPLLPGETFFSEQFFESKRCVLNFLVCNTTCVAIYLFPFFFEF